MSDDIGRVHAGAVIEHGRVDRPDVGDRRDLALIGPLLLDEGELFELERPGAVAAEVRLVGLVGKACRKWISSLQRSLTPCAGNKSQTACPVAWARWRVRPPKRPSFDSPSGLGSDFGCEPSGAGLLVAVRHRRFAGTRRRLNPGVGLGRLLRIATGLGLARRAVARASRGLGGLRLAFFPREPGSVSAYRR